jgi:putative peptidoglycan lipid II flippase
MRTAARTAALMAALTLGSKILGFLREVFMAGFFGTSYITDAYVMASAIPGIIFAGIFTSVSVSYMPLFSNIVEKEGQDRANRFTSEAITLSMGVAIIISVLGVIFSDELVSIFAKGFEGEAAALTSLYVKIIFPYIIFIAGAGLLEAYLQYKGVFLKPVLAGYLQSGFVLAGIIVGAFYSHYFLPFGLLLGYMLRMVAIAISAKKQGFIYKATSRINDSAKQIMLLALPVFLGSTVNQINTFVDKMLASGLQEGSVAALNYGQLLINLITNLTITVIVTIIYPRLTQSLAIEDHARFNDSVSKGISIIMIIGIPCSLGAMLYSQIAVEIVYERGAFDSASTALTGPAFFYYAIGLTFIALNALLVKVYYSMQDTKTPVICGVVGASANIVLNLLLVGIMAHRGLALATSIAAIINTLLLIIMLKTKYPMVRMIDSGAKMGKIILSSVIAVAISYLAYCSLDRVVNDLPAIVLLFFVVLAACVAYLLLLRLLRVEELSMLRDLLRNRKM